MSRHSRTGVRGSYRLSDGRFGLDLRWRDPRTGEAHRYRETLPAALTAVAAKLRARELLSAALSGEFDPDRAPAKSLGDAFVEYGKWCDSNRPRAAKRRKAIAARLLIALGDQPLDRLSPLDVERFKRDRRAKGAAPATVNRDLEVLVHFYGLAESWGWCGDAVARAIRGVPHYTEPPGRVRYLKPDEEKRLLAATPRHVRPLIIAAIHSGMRQSELVTLTTASVDLDARMITLTRTKANRVRRVEINDSLAAVLRQALAGLEREFVFVSRRGERYTADGLRSIFRRAVDRAGIADFRFHDLCHTTATRLRRAGAGLDLVATVLGHATLAMAQRYSHLGAENVKAAMATLPAPPLVTDAPASVKRSRTRARGGPAAALGTA